MATVPSLNGLFRAMRTKQRVGYVRGRKARQSAEREVALWRRGIHAVRAGGAFDDGLATERTRRVAASGLEKVVHRAGIRATPAVDAARRSARSVLPLAGDHVAAPIVDGRQQGTIAPEFRDAGVTNVAVVRHGPCKVPGLRRCAHNSEPSPEDNP